MDSIREAQTKDDIITELLMMLSDDINDEKTVVLVEGSDDVEFVEKMFEENVICRESYTGKHGIKELLLSTELQRKQIIAIRDRDYMSLEELTERMFVYDHCCLEMTLLANHQVTESFHRAVYRGQSSADQYIEKALRILAPYSVLRRKNELEGLGISFQKVGFGDLVTIEERLDVKELFQRLRLQDMATFFENCAVEADALSVSELWSITNGHDICTYLGVLSKMGKKTLSESDVRTFLMALYRKEDFRDTQLYGDICTYQRNHQVKFVN